MVLGLSRQQAQHSLTLRLPLLALPQSHRTREPQPVPWGPGEPRGLCPTGVALDLEPVATCTDAQLSLHCPVCQVYLPALSFTQHKDIPSGFIQGDVPFPVEYEMNLPSLPGESVEFHSIQLMRDEFLMNLQKFVSSIQRIIQQLEGEPGAAPLASARPGSPVLAPCCRHRAGLSGAPGLTRFSFMFVSLACQLCMMFIM